MKKILKATLCISLAVLMGAIAPIITVIMSKNRGLPAGFEAAYLPEEEDDYSGLAAEPVPHNYDFGAVRPGASLAYSASGYTTHTSVGSKFAAVDNKTLFNHKCTAMQGMNVGTTYIYTAKVVNGTNAAAAIFRTNAKTGEQVTMSYYSSLTATSPSSCNTLGHANDLTVVTNTENGKSVNYMYVATCVTGYPGVARLKIDGTKLYFTGFFKLKKTSDNKILGMTTAIRGVRHAGGYQYFLVKSGLNFYTFRVAEGAKGGSKSAPTVVDCYFAFKLDTRNAIFVSSSGKVSTIDGIDKWINQGFGYSSEQKTIYVPIYDGTKQNDNAILIYNVADKLTAARLDSKKNYTNDVLFPLVETLRITNSSYELFEVESCGFRTGQGTSGDLALYFNINGRKNKKDCDAIWRISSFTRKSSAPSAMIDSSSITYKVKYDNNCSKKENVADTYHIKGISARLRTNEFTRKGYTFIGWHLTRGDEKWLYVTLDGSTRWYKKGTQPAGARLALYEDGRKVSALTGTKGDTVICYAQWQPVSTGTKSYYIRYDANGGSGTMADTKVVYGTSTAIRQNAFSRDGYTFGGWNAYRMSDNSWLYVNNSTGANKWIPVGSSTAGYTLKVYSNGCRVAKTSSTDRDIVTFYAVWKTK